VCFFDASLPHSNDTDVVVHHEPAISPPDHVIDLERAMGALEIPVDTYHRSISGEEGSLVLNQSIRDPDFSYATEFIPVCLADRPDLQTARAVEPWRWSWHNGHIPRQHGAWLSLPIG
jgi:hypothetical protein